MKTISVCIPTYNGARFIVEQLDSILQQSIPVNEIIISDDSSTDDSVELIKQYKDSRIKLYDNQHFSSPVYNMEYCLQQCSGDIIFLADQDDIWEANKVEVMLRHLKKHLLVVSDASIIDVNGKAFSPSVFALLGSRQGLLKNFIRNSYMGCCMAFRRELLELVLPFPQHIAMHDLWIGMNAEIYAKPYFETKQLLRYRRHEHNQTPLHAAGNSHPLSYKISFRLQLLWSLLLRFSHLKLGRKSSR